MPYKDITKRREKALEFYYLNREKILPKKREEYLKNQEAEIERSMNYYLNNREIILPKKRAYNKKYVIINKAQLTEAKRKYNLLNRDKLRLANRKWTGENRESVREYHRDYNKNQRKTNPNFVIAERIRARLKIALKMFTGKGKLLRSREYGIDYSAIIEHLKPFPEDTSKYHVDHIKPLCSFDLTKLEQVRLAFAPENHQWLKAEDNMRKGGKLQWITT